MNNSKLTIYLFFLQRQLNRFLNRQPLICLPYYPLAGCFLAALCLNPIRGKTWGWVAFAAIGEITLYLLVYAAGRPILKIIYDAVPDPEILKRVLGDSTTFVGYPLSGNFQLLGIYLTYYFFNIRREEFWWRGYIFPKQELVHGSRTWLIHGCLWAGFHLFSPYNVLMVLPGALLLSWITQKQQINWIFLIAHASINILAMIRIISGIVS